jgi:hypothetical protein
MNTSWLRVVGGIASCIFLEAFFYHPIFTTSAFAQSGNCNYLNIAAGASMNCSNNTGGGNTNNAGPRDNKSEDALSDFGGDAVRIVSGNAMMAYAEIGTTFTIENRSGIPVGVGVLENSTSLGPCSTIMQWRGLPIISNSQVQQIRNLSDPYESLQYFPAGGKATVASAVGRFQCPIQQGMRIQLITSLVIAAKSHVFIMPANFELPVQ